MNDNETNISQELQKPQFESLVPVVSQEAVENVIQKLEDDPTYLADAINRLEAEQTALGEMFLNMIENGKGDLTGFVTLLVLEEQLRTDQHEE